MNKMPWLEERVPTLSINPDMATREDIARLAADLIEVNQKIVKLRIGIEQTIELLTKLPSGIDYDADASEQSPENAVTHIGGLIWQDLTNLLEETK